MSDLRPFELRSAEHLRLVLETSHIGIWELDLKSGLAVRNRTHDKIFGYDGSLEEWSYDQFLSHVAEKDRLRVDSLQKAAIREKREWSFDCQITTNDGQKRWIRASGRPLLDDAGHVTTLIGHVLDITETKNKEAMLQLITEELKHRVRNTLGIINSMIMLTATTTNSTSEFAETLKGRVGALARTQDLIMGTASSAMIPSAILEAEFAAFQTCEGQIRISVDSEAPLPAMASKGLALVTHELLTNAIKYGALSVPDGRIDVAIDLQDGATVITWTERGGPAPQGERRQGFGSMLIADALAGEGTVEQVFAPEGLMCRITITAG